MICHKIVKFKAQLFIRDSDILEDLFLTQKAVAICIVITDTKNAVCAYFNASVVQQMSIVETGDVA